MNKLLLMFLQCGAFVLIPLSTFFVGLWIIVKLVGMNSRISVILIAIVIGISFFEASAIGMLVDPRASLSRLSEIFKISSVLGLAVTISVLAFIPIYRGIVNMFK